jgi:hypothetical protein
VAWVVFISGYTAGFVYGPALARGLLAGRCEGLQRPNFLIQQALMLKYKPVNLDVLPLYIVLLLVSPLILWGLVRRPAWTLLGSALLYVAARWFNWNLPSFPGGSWYFNPFPWRLLFVFGARCGLGGATKLAPLTRSRTVLILAAAD